jgi:hypothetical protein
MDDYSFYVFLQVWLRFHQKYPIALTDDNTNADPPNANEPGTWRYTV